MALDSCFFPHVTENMYINRSERFRREEMEKYCGKVLYYTRNGIIHLKVDYD